MYRPDFLKSAGLTNHPNLPFICLNEAQPDINETMKNKSSLNSLRCRESPSPNEATDDQIAAALNQFGDRVIAAEPPWRPAAWSWPASTSELANERAFHIDTLLGQRIGRRTHHRGGNVPSGPRVSEAISPMNPTRWRNSRPC